MSYNHYYWGIHPLLPHYHHYKSQSNLWGYSSFSNGQTSVSTLSTPCLIYKIGWQKAEPHLSLQHSVDSVPWCVAWRTSTYSQITYQTSWTGLYHHQHTPPLANILLLLSLSLHALVLSLTSLWKSGRRKIAKCVTWSQEDSEQEAGCKAVTSGKEWGYRTMDLMKEFPRRK